MILYKKLTTGTQKQTINNFIKHMNSGHPVIVLYYADWCGHCHEFKPIFDKTAKRILKHFKGDLSIYSIEDSLLQKLSRSNQFIENEIPGYPTVLYYSSTNDIASNKEMYSGERTSSELLKWIKNKSTLKRLKKNTQKNKQKRGRRVRNRNRTKRM